MNLASIPNTFRKWKLASLGASKQALIDKTNADLRSLSAQIKKVKAELDIEKLEKELFTTNLSILLKLIDNIESLFCHSEKKN